MESVKIERIDHLGIVDGVIQYLCNECIWPQ